MTDKITIISRFKGFKRKYFPERQLFLRSEGRVRFVTFGSYTQMFMASVALGTVLWGVGFTLAYLTSEDKLFEKEQEMAAISGRYQELSGDFSILEKEIEKRAKNLEERQKLLENVIGLENPTLTEANLPIDAKQDKDASPKEEKSKQAEDGPSSFLNGILKTDPVHAAEIRPVTPLEANKSRRKKLLFRLALLEERQKASVTQMIENYKQEFNQVDTVFAKTKVTSDHLIKAATKTTGMGGPSIPVNANELFNKADRENFESLMAISHQYDLMQHALDSVPTHDPAEKYYISSKYGKRFHPIKKVWEGHKALDLAGWPGTKIFSGAQGKILKAGYYGVYGRMIEIDHGNGFRTRYGHMRKLRVKVGDTVEAGHHIGDMGSTGRSTSSHLHYEVWFNNKIQNPLPYIRAEKNVQKIKQRKQKPTEFSGR
ncbi:peptidoglycan DD-metalloendopeptidase family protein [Temperatibacter marinus]|uniref:Peptidoglycan DD-metalloendopeptidase family protein n=1 Tax=Temperatibacter marinus TaxID=1456591 RepID=A0AA52EGV3_9PROT|nr:peptidoglycan DD-metalloendopeptidase family protein [Temperatibacter marinus]WND02277.1 peptidoglycan DD-metalloendopeptidase family protein [Temperatibacter marinus]